MKLLLTILMMASNNVMSYSQNNKSRYKAHTIAFYNLENLFDTINNPNKKDELSPILEMKGNRTKVYRQKLDNLGKVIHRIGSKLTNTSPTLLGVCEIENDTVLQDLVSTKQLEQSKYAFIHRESPDDRGIDVALIYKPKYFKPTHYEAINPDIFVENIKINTRDILWVTGYLDDQEIHLIINHWPSRRGGAIKSSYLREKAAFSVKRLIERIHSNYENPKIIVMGDFNDNPIDKSLKSVLESRLKADEIHKIQLYNPFEALYKKGLNTLGYRDNIHLFDQILVSKDLISVNKKFKTFRLFKPSIFNPNFLIQQSGRYKGYPFRSFQNGNFSNGYSDHFPVYIYLLKKK